jgi:hypothetical protein
VCGTGGKKPADRFPEQARLDSIVSPAAGGFKEGRASPAGRKRRSSARDLETNLKIFCGLLRRHCR